MSHSLNRALERLVTRHQRRVMWRTALSGALGAACVALVVWRLERAHVATRTMAWVGGALLGTLAGWHGWLLSRGWLSARATLAKLDRELGLQARLITAAEFAHVPQPPALYPTLVRETTQSLEAASTRSPSVASRSSLALAGGLLLLWFWPWPAPPNS